jgi:hypothetical protein
MPMISRVQRLEVAIARAGMLLQDCQERKAQQALELLVEALEFKDTFAPNPLPEHEAPEQPDEPVDAHFVGRK